MSHEFADRRKKNVRVRVSAFAVNFVNAYVRERQLTDVQEEWFSDALDAVLHDMYNRLRPAMPVQDNRPWWVKRLRRWFR